MQILAPRFAPIFAAAVLSAAAVASQPAMAAPQQAKAATAAVAPSTLKTQSYAIGQNIVTNLHTIGKLMDAARFEQALRDVIAGKPHTMEAARAEQILTSVRSAEITALPAGVAAGDLAAALGEYLVGPSVNAIKNDVQLDELMRGVRTTLAGKPELSKDVLVANLQAFNQVYQANAAARSAKLAETNRAEGATFLARNKTAPGVKTTASGLQYLVLRDGNGPRPLPTQKVRVNYEGRLLDGTVFDSSYKRNQPAEFPLDRVIKGWTEGLGLMPVGSKYRLFIPSEIAYGATPRAGSPIGPNAVLVFDVELLNILP